MRVVVLAGGYDQIALIEELKSRGSEVVLVDYYSNPPAKRVADRHYVASTLDVPEVRSIVRKEKADLLVTACTDQALLTMARVSEELGLPCYITYEKAQRVTNKALMKPIMEEAGIPTPKYAVIGSIRAGELDVNSFKFPVVVKPADCNSSKGVEKVHSEKEYYSSVERALRLSRTNTCVVEEFVDGIEVSVDVFVADGRSSVLLLTETRKVPNTTAFTIVQSKYPVRTSERAYRRICSIAQSVCDSFEIENGPLLMQAIVQGDDVSVLEFSARMGGGTKYKLIEVLTGVDIMKAYVDLVMGIDPQISCSHRFNYAHLNYCYASNGTFCQLEGFEHLKQMGVIHDYFQYKTKGTRIEKATTSSDRVAGYLVVSNEYDALLKKERTADCGLKILCDSGRDLMIHNLVSEAASQ